MFNKTNKTLVELLTSYAPAELFTNDTPSKQEKKLESRCIKIVDSFYHMSYFAELRGKLNAVLLYETMGHNEYGTNSFLVECAELQAYLEFISKGIKKKVKPEKCLVQFYDHVVPEAKFSTVFEQLLTQLSSSKSKVPVDVKVMKTLYFNTLKLTRKSLKEDTRYVNIL